MNKKGGSQSKLAEDVRSASTEEVAMSEQENGVAPQLLGYGLACLFRNYLLDSPFMWWPANLAQVSLFRALHEKEKRPKGGFTRLQFFLLDLVTSFAYYVIPGFLFPTISVISLVSYMWKDSITAHQIGSAIHGLGIGWFGLDWATIAGFLGSPLVVPAFAIFKFHQTTAL